jgi:hypothetical protein
MQVMSQITQDAKEDDDDKIKEEDHKLIPDAAWIN